MSAGARFLAWMAIFGSQALGAFGSTTNSGGNGLRQKRQPFCDTDTPQRSTTKKSIACTTLWPLRSSDHGRLRNTRWITLPSTTVTGSENDATTEWRTCGGLRATSSEKTRTKAHRASTARPRRQRRPCRTTKSFERLRASSCRSTGALAIFTGLSTRQCPTRGWTTRLLARQEGPSMFSWRRRSRTWLPRQQKDRTLSITLTKTKQTTAQATCVGQRDQSSSTIRRAPPRTTSATTKNQSKFGRLGQAVGPSIRRTQMLHVAFRSSMAASFLHSPCHSSSEKIRTVAQCGCARTPVGAFDQRSATNVGSADTLFARAQYEGVSRMQTSLRRRHRDRVVRRVRCCPLPIRNTRSQLLCSRLPHVPCVSGPGPDHRCAIAPPALRTLCTDSHVPCSLAAQSPTSTRTPAAARSLPCPSGLPRVH